MVKNLISYFIPDIYKDRDLGPKELLDYKRSYLLGLIMIMSSLTGLLFSIVKVFVFSVVNWQSILSVLLTVALMSTAFFHKKYNHYEKCASTVAIILTGFITWRAHLCCGFQSPFMNWYIGLPVFFGFILNRNKQYLFAALLCTLTIVYFFTTKDIGPIQDIKYVYVKLFILIIGISATASVVGILSKHQEDFNETVDNMNKKAMLGEMIQLYNHELNNPMLIAKGNLERYQLTKDEKFLKKAEEALEQMDKTVLKINEISKQDDLLESKRKEHRFIKRELVSE